MGQGLHGTTVSNVVACALVVLMACLSLLPSKSLAQDDPGAVEEILVTGSRIKRASLESASPLLVVDREDIDISGFSGVGDLLQDLSISGSGFNSQFNNNSNSDSSKGETHLNLRNLGTKRVLVLLNGRRFASNIEGIVDLNNLPLAVIERIEILKDGASSIYGSDAISGVVNLITRDRFEGFQANAYVGQFGSQNDGEIQSYDFSVGSASDQGSVYLNASYLKQEPVFAEDRRISAEPVFGTGTSLGSFGTPQGAFCAFAVNGCDAVLTTDPGTDVTGPNGLGAAAFRPGDFAQNLPGAGLDRYNYAPEFFLQPTQERTGIFVQAGYQLFDATRVSAEVSYNRRESTQRWSVQPLIIGLFLPSGTAAGDIGIAADNAFNPFGITFSPRTFALARRLSESDPRIFSQEVDSYRFGFGLNGGFQLKGRRFDWDLSYVFAQIDRADTDSGRINIQRVSQALSGQPCRDDVFGDGCVELNVFGGQGPDGLGTITRDMLDYIQFTASNRFKDRLTNYTANITGDLLELPAGSLAFAAGYEYRFHEGALSRDSLQAAGFDSDFIDPPIAALAGDFAVDEVYLEMALPLLADRAGARRLDVSVSSRYSDYETADGEANSKVGLEWQPVEDLLLRATYSEGFRAPTIFELFQPVRTISIPAIADPCLGVDTDGDGIPDTTPPLPGCAGVPGDLAADDAAPFQSILGGNQRLDPESSESTTLGLVYSPHWLDGLNVTVDYYKIELDQTIEQTIGNIVLGVCSNTGTVLCDRVHRDPVSGRLLEVDGTAVNIGGSEVEGVDFSLSYRFPEAPWGQFRVNWDGAYQGVNTDTVVASDGSGFVVINNLGATGFIFEEGSNGTQQLDASFPRWKSDLRLQWSRGNWDANWGVQYIHGTSEDCFIHPGFGFCNLDLDGDGDPGDGRRIGATTYHDVQLSYQLGALDARLTAGVQNLFDKGPPMSTNVLVASFNRADYRVPGRFPYVRISIDF